jgi:hypothetical protein
MYTSFIKLAVLAERKIPAASRLYCTWTYVGEPGLGREVSPRAQVGKVVGVAARDVDNFLGCIYMHERYVHTYSIYLE